MTRYQRPSKRSPRRNQAGTRSPRKTRLLPPIAGRLLMFIGTTGDVLSPKADEVMRQRLLGSMRLRIACARLRGTVGRWVLDYGYILEFATLPCSSLLPLIRMCSSSATARGTYLTRSAPSMNPQSHGSHNHGPVHLLKTLAAKAPRAENRSHTAPSPSMAVMRRANTRRLRAAMESQLLSARITHLADFEH
ncbi:hypothetical protein A4X13_0g4731 [Tilletia indica]|uniref:Uncharacterized protein n=1 Tax=Tilletia indica TaxID=43049 RepID=A0A177TP90_9BASI|nr:hypothetical protein A4X13_0g4731 [Tilletia indica]